ncbi:hypothetical protein MPSEU_000997000 [Mayamaea pseudoterrestris]|nr:hypothetical protein MPSEU_000997000 [Mayamaea pseudoterrestris]
MAATIPCHAARISMRALSSLQWFLAASSICRIDGFSFSSTKKYQRRPAIRCRRHDGPSAYHPFSTFPRCFSTTSISFSSKEQTPEESRMTRDCLNILQSAIRAVDPATAIRTHLQKHDASNKSFKIGDRLYDLDSYEQILLIGFGKASSAMAVAVLEQLQQNDIEINRISGLIIVKDGHATFQEQETLARYNVIVRETGHPIPDQRSVDASNELLELVTRVDHQHTSRRLILACISGGGSSLFCAPQPPLTLTDLQDTNQVLLQSGWPIQDMNVLRKRLERGKGGRLAQASLAATSNGNSDMVSLILSDVLGDPLDLIASGPTVPDGSTWADAWRLVQERLSPSQRLALPTSVKDLLQKGMDGELPNSPSNDDPFFERCHNVLVGNNEAAVMAAAAKAMELGYQPLVLGTRVTGEASHVARTLVNVAQHVRQGPPAYNLAHPPAALICGGETTVTIPQGCTGLGGRNQEMALAAALALKEAKLRQIVFSSVGTDGTDGPTDAAGAIVDGNTIDRLRGDAAQALANHDAYTYLAQTDDNGLSPLVKTGPTGTNVADVTVILIDSKEG